jgi:general secretion pathway protein A
VKKESRGAGLGRCGRGACPPITRSSSINKIITGIICYIRGNLGVTTRSSRASLQYEEFYGFAHSPFTLAPDPRFLYRSPSHEEAIRLLLQAIRRREGVAVLSGDIGTGKTTVCRTVLEQLDMTLFTSLVLNPFLSGEELLREILLDFGVVSREAVRSGRVAAASRHELIETLHEFLTSLVPIGASGVLIIDEAQHLSPQVLEEIRVLSNLETNRTKLLQIVLVGQLNLLDVLKQPEQRQIDQRVSLRTVLAPLGRLDLEAYVMHRLSVAGEMGQVAFDDAALDLVQSISGGVPRLINLICDRALMIGAQSDARVITTHMIRGAIGSLGLQPARRLFQLRMPRLPKWPSFFRWRRPV